MDKVIESLKSGELVAFLGMGIFKNIKNSKNQQLPYDSNSMILSLNNGRVMSSRLMYEYTRAAMSIEQRRGREYLVELTNFIYKEEYPLAVSYKLLQEVMPKYVIDTNLDNSLQKIYSKVEHFLIVGVSRIMASPARYICYRYDGREYKEIKELELNETLPILFKPLGSNFPEKNFIISDADFVDWLTEAMGGFAMPKFLKGYKEHKSYLFLGVDFSKDTFRMVVNELTLGLKGGFIVTKKELSKKEQKFITNHNLEVINQEIDEFIKELI